MNARELGVRNEHFHIGVEMGGSSSDSDGDIFSLLANEDSHGIRL